MKNTEHQQFLVVERFNKYYEWNHIFNGIYWKSDIL